MADVKKQSSKTAGLSGISKYIREVRAEMNKVVWPTRKQIINNTAVVIVSICLVGVVIWALDSVFSGALFNYIKK